MIQAHFIYCALYFYYYYISSTSDHQALLDPGGWEPCTGLGAVVVAIFNLQFLRAACCLRDLCKV